MNHLDTPQALLYYMMLIREFELKIAEAFAYGKLAGTMFHLSVGQEATSVGTISALRDIAGYPFQDLDAVYFGKPEVQKDEGRQAVGSPLIRALPEQILQNFFSILNHY